MNILTNKYKREGLIGTLIVHGLLLLFFLLTGLTYMVPKPEQGVLINFGNSTVGSGTQETPNPTQTEPTPQPNEASTSTPSEPVPTENTEITTQDNVETIEVPTEKTEQTRVEPEQPTETEETPTQEEKQEISNPLKNALNKLKNTPASSGSEGNDADEVGNKGQQNGTNEGGAYSGAPGGGGDGNYNLGNRKALTKPRPAYNCQEEGTVVIEVRVDRSGKTIDAKVAKGTTNFAECLTKQAEKAAMQTKWQAKPDAPFTQIGTITYRFILN